MHIITVIKNFSLLLSLSEVCSSKNLFQKSIIDNTQLLIAQRFLYRKYFSHGALSLSLTDGGEKIKNKKRKFYVSTYTSCLALGTNRRIAANDSHSETRSRYFRYRASSRA